MGKSYNLRSNIKIAPEVLMVESGGAALDVIPPSLSNNSPAIEKSPTVDVASFSFPSESTNGVKDISHPLRNQRTLTAFVVDDVQSIRKMLGQILTKNKFVVECFPNGAQALDAMKLKVVDVVFMDLQMPIMSGPEAVRRLRAFEKETGRQRQFIVATSANIDSEEELETLGFDTSLPKPIRMSEIISFVETYIPNYKV